MATDYEQNLNMNLTTSAGVQPLYQPVLNRHLLTVAKPEMIHHQFGQKVSIPKGTGKVVAWDKMSPLPKAKIPLTEGITPKGSAINISRITATPEQYGAYISTTDQFDFFTPDPSPKVLDINETLGRNAAETLDSLTADVLSAGTNVQYAGGKTARANLTAADKLTVDEVMKATRTLKGNKAQKINGDYVAIIHTDIAYDLMKDPLWQRPHEYADPKNIYSGEIGRLYGVRYVESPDAVIFYGNKFADKYDELQVVKVDGKKIYIAETLETADATKMASRKIIVNGFVYTVSSATKGENGDAYLTCSENFRYHNDLYIADKLHVYRCGTEAPSEWECQSVVLYEDIFDNKGVNEIWIRADIADGAKVTVYTKINGDTEWKEHDTLTAQGLKVYRVPVRFNRDEYFQYRLKGEGEAVIYNIEYIVNTGGRPYKVNIV